MHELEIVNGEAAMAYRQSSGVPWHVALEFRLKTT